MLSQGKPILPKLSQLGHPGPSLPSSDAEVLSKVPAAARSSLLASQWSLPSHCASTVLQECGLATLSGCSIDSLPEWSEGVDSSSTSEWLAPGWSVTHKVSSPGVLRHAMIRLIFSAATNLFALRGWFGVAGACCFHLETVQANAGLSCRTHGHTKVPQSSAYCSCFKNRKTPPVGLEPTIFGLEVRRLVH